MTHFIVEKGIFQDFSKEPAPIHYTATVFELFVMAN